VALWPFMEIKGEQIVLARYISFHPKIAFFSLVFVVSFLMIIYLILDFFFSFSVRFSLKGCKNYKNKYGFLKEIFEEIKFNFNCPNVKLYIKESDEINAFAVSGMRKKAIVLTSGLINHYAENIEDNTEFLIAIRAILGHEASHLINKDYLPGLLMIINQKATDIAAFILTILFHILIRTFYHLRMSNYFITSAMIFICNITRKILNLFNRLVVIKIYNFINNFFGRAIEYRCDRQSAKAFGGINTAFALSWLGKSGYFTLFSTHPATARRMKKVRIVEEKNAIIHASFFSQFSNFISLFILPLICIYAAHVSKISLLIQNYIFYYHRDFYLFFLKLINIISQ
jgi:Zn-dependent protease with chaperone function